MPWEGDDKILDIVRELCRQLQMTSYNPTNITWKSEVQSGSTRYGRPIYGVLPYDECVLASNTVILPENMRDQLTPDEWKPIIASALFYKKTLRMRIINGLTLRVLLFIGVAAALFVGLPILLPQPVTTVDKYGVPYTNPLGWMIATIAGPLIAIAGTAVLAIVYLKNVRLLADKDAAEIVGAPVFLAVLNKNRWPRCEWIRKNRQPTRCRGQVSSTHPTENSQSSSILGPEPSRTSLAM